MYRILFYETLGKCQALAPTMHKFLYENKLLSLDSSTISLCLGLFTWAKFRKTKGAVKLHLLLNHDGYLQSFVHITSGSTHDVTLARNLNIASESIVAMDQAYIDYKLFCRWTEDHVRFVTRTKSKAASRVVETRAVPKNRNIISGEDIEFTDK
ncbi:transposase [Desulfoluna butyratoxydans]|nr:transposase [Desulfoluna butyratoxydans]